MPSREKGGLFHQFCTCEARCRPVWAFPVRDGKVPSGEEEQGFAGKADCFGPAEIDTSRKGMDDYKERIRYAQEFTERFLNGKKYMFSGLVPSDLQEIAAVYAIFDKKDGSCLYVGRTKNLRQRLYDYHLMGPESNARLKKCLAEDVSRPDIPTMAEAKQFLKDRCYFQYILVSDIHERGQLEGLLSYTLNVQYIHEEHWL